MPGKHSRVGVAVLSALVVVVLVAGTVGQLAGIGLIRAERAAGLLLIALGAAAMVIGLLQRRRSQRPPG